MNYYRIKTEDVIHNYRTLSAHTGAMIIPMLKANAYGLGDQKVLEILEQEGVQTFALSRLEEAEGLATASELLVLSCYHGREELELLAAKGYTAAIDSLSQAKLLDSIAKNLNKKVKVHIAVDSGFGRFGFTPDAVESMAQVFELEHLEVGGIFSHLGAAFVYKNDFADRQLEKFLQTIEALKNKGCKLPLCHIANSSAMMRDKKFHLDAVRIGSALCGRMPVAFDVDLKRVGELVSHIIDIRYVPKDSNIGYGLVYRTKRKTKVAVLPIGTAEGVQLSKDYDAFRFRDFCRYGLKLFKMMLKKDNRMRVCIGGKSAAVLGRVAMTHTMIDVTDIDCAVGDEVVIPISPLYVADHVERRYE